MTTPNPLYQYLLQLKQSNQNCQAQVWQEKSHYFLHELSLPKGSMLYINEKKWVVQEHHISVYAVIDDGVGFQSLYHYTATCLDAKLHIYFNAKDEPIEVMLTHDRGDTRLTHLLNDDNPELLGSFFKIEQQIGAVIQPLRAQQDFEIDSIKTIYTAQLENIKRSLFEQSEQIEENLNLIEDAIKRGESLLLISYEKKFLKQTLKYLHQDKKLFLELLSMPTPSLLSVADDSPSSTLQAVSSSKPRSLKKAPKQPLSLTSRVTPDMVESFRHAQDKYLAAWHVFNTCSSLSEKLKLFNQLGHHDLRELNSHALGLLDRLESASKKEEKELVCKVDLEVGVLQESYTITGVNLLLQCLQPAETRWLEQYSGMFKNFVTMLTREQVESTILEQNLPALTFLLNHSAFNLNHYLVKIEKDQLLSPLCAAYKFKNVPMFKLFLNHKASCMASYIDLPLAHTLLQLEANDPFQLCFLKDYAPVIDGNPRFYKTLARAVSSKLKDEALDQTQKVELDSSLKHYLRICQSNQEGFKLSPSLRNSVVAIRGEFNPETIRNLRTLSNGEKELFKQLEDESRALCQLMRRQHRQGQLMSTIQKEYKKAEGMIKNGLGSLIRELSKEDIIQVIARQLTLIKACRDILNLSSRCSLNVNERKQLNQAATILNEAQKHQAPSSREIAEVNAIDELQESLDRIRKAIDELANFLKPFDVTLKAPYLEQAGVKRSSSLVIEGFFKPDPLQSRMPEDRTLADPYGPGAIVPYKPYVPGT